MSGINALMQASKDTNFIKNVDDKDIIKIIAQAITEKNFSHYECGTAFKLLRNSNIKWKNLDQISQNLIINLTNYIESCSASEIIFILEGLSNLGILFKNNESIYIRALTRLNNNLSYFNIEQTIFLLSALCKAEIKYSDLEYYKDIQDILIDFITKKARSFNNTIIFNIFCFLDDFFIKSQRINNGLWHFKNVFLHSISVESEKFTPKESIEIWSLLKKFNIKEWSNIPKTQQCSIFEAIQNNINEFEKNQNDNELTDYSNNILKIIKEYKVKWYLLSNPAQNTLIQLIKKKTETCSIDTLNFLLSISKSLELKWTYIPYFDKKLINCIRNNLNNFDNDLILEALFRLYKYEILWDHLQGLDVHLLDFISQRINNLSFFQISCIIISLSKFDINWETHHEIYKNLLDQFDKLNIPQNSDLDIHILANLFLALAEINALNFERLRTLIKNFDKEALINPMQFINNVPDKHILKFYTAICYLQLELAEKNLPEEEDFKNFIKILTTKSNMVQKTYPVTTSQEQKDITKIIQKFCNITVYEEHPIKCKMVDILIPRYNAPSLVIEVDGKYHFTPKETYLLSTIRKQNFLKRCGYEVISINLLKEWTNKTDHYKEQFIYKLLIKHNVINEHRSLINPLNDPFTKDCNMLTSGLSRVSAPSHGLFFNKGVHDSQINMQLPINTFSMHHITKQETPSIPPSINENIYAAKPGAFSSSHASLKLQKANSSISHQSVFVLSVQYPINAIDMPSSMGSYGRNSGPFSEFSTQQHSSSPTLERKNENEKNKRPRLKY